MYRARSLNKLCQLEHFSENKFWSSFITNQWAEGIFTELKAYFREQE